MRARQGKAGDIGAEREHHVWYDLVYLLLTQDYLQDNNMEKTRRKGETDGEKRLVRWREKPKRLKE